MKLGTSDWPPSYLRKTRFRHKTTHDKHSRPNAEKIEDVISIPMLALWYKKCCRSTVVLRALIDSKSLSGRSTPPEVAPDIRRIVSSTDNHTAQALTTETEALTLYLLLKTIVCFYEIVGSDDDKLLTDNWRLEDQLVGPLIMVDA